MNGVLPFLPIYALITHASGDFTFNFTILSTDDIGQSSYLDI
jgi:hypothetical protein